MVNSFLYKSSSSFDFFTIVSKSVTNTSIWYIVLYAEHVLYPFHFFMLTTKICSTYNTIYQMESTEYSIATDDKVRKKYKIVILKQPHCGVAALFEIVNNVFWLWTSDYCHHFTVFGQVFNHSRMIHWYIFYLVRFKIGGWSINIFHVWATVHRTSSSQVSRDGIIL